jgi:hypothetical protein
MRSGFDFFISRCIAYQELPSIPDPLETQLRVAKLRNGSATEEELNWLVMNHLRLTLSIVAQHAKPWNAADFEGDALLHLVYLVKKKAPAVLFDNNLTAYLSAIFSRSFRRLSVARSGVDRRRDLVETLPDLDVYSYDPGVPIVDILDRVQTLARSPKEQHVLKALLRGGDHTETVLRRTEFYKVRLLLRARFEAA